MADHKACKHYEDCDYRNGVGSCPDRCVQFKNKDTVTVVRCKDCECTAPGTSGLVCTMWGAGTDPDGWCYKAERKGK